MKIPNPESTMVPGPSLTPADDLLGWLEGRPKGALIRLPVVVHFSEGRFGIDQAYIAVSPGPRDSALQLSLDDTALGISLLDRLQGQCPAAQAFCAVWIDGHWGALVAPPPVDIDEADAKKHPFAVRNLHGLIKTVPSKPTVFVQD